MHVYAGVTSNIIPSLLIPTSEQKCTTFILMKEKWLTELTLYMYQIQWYVGGIDNKLEDVSFSYVAALSHTLLAKYV